ncbi:hypothetical protein ElyMa_000276000 [Elysia marginata]|uniref:Uncharacterized protein n=1 Tax=Elysia marginata TaxID=1093978 RepID=A0AAV4F4Z3_9GAST|nr:hypothetical protein ElyMa_000276000 [Elysia marginata]
MYIDDDDHDDDDDDSGDDEYDDDDDDDDHDDDDDDDDDSGDDDRINSNSDNYTKVGQRGRVVSASDSRSEGRGFDSRPCRVAVALGKQFTLTFPSPPTCKMGTQLQTILEFVIYACNTLQMDLKWP